MLRLKPKPLRDAVLAIDPASVNCGFCCFDAQSQSILYLERKPLLAKHEPIVRSVDQVKAALDQVTAAVTTLLQGRPFYVVLDEQFVSKTKHPIVFSVQLETAITMYYQCKDIPVVRVGSKERYDFLDIDRKLSAYKKKAAATNKLKGLITSNNPFARNPAHKTEAFRGKLDDMSDAAAMALAQMYRQHTDVMERKVVRASVTTDNPLDIATPARPGSSRQQKRAKTESISSTTVKAELQKLMTRLQMSEHYAAMRGLPSNAAKLRAVHQREPNRKDVAAFMALLNRWNHQGIDVRDEYSLSNRL